MLRSHIQVDGDNQKVDGTGCRRHPHRQGVWGPPKQRPVGGPGGKAPRSKMDLVFSHLLKLPFLRAINSNSLFS